MRFVNVKKIEASGSDIKDLMEDKLLINVDDDRLSAGGLNFGVYRDTHVQFDDVVITEL